MALERAVQALACWYDPRPLIGVLDRLRSSDRQVAAPALEFLERALPRSIFSSVRKVFEEPAIGGAEDATADPLAARIEAAWASEDGWLRACAVRASRFASPLDPSRLDADGDPLVRAELAALRSPLARPHARVPQVAPC
jgi:hypothetical protein